MKASAQVVDEVVAGELNSSCLLDVSEPICDPTMWESIFIALCKCLF